MKEYIEKETALASIRHEDPYFAYAIERIPAADAAPVKHGRWIAEDFTGIIKCSECRNDAPLDTTGGGQYFSPFCQNCGARMDGDRDV